MIKVDPFDGIPVYQQIVEQVRLAVARGELKPGDKLEPVRQIAGRLEVNPSTVARAYQLLEHDGIIETNRRRGSVISRLADADALHLRLAREVRLRGIVERSLVEALAQGYSTEEVQAALDLQLAVWRERRARAELEDPPSVSHARMHPTRSEDGPASVASSTIRFAGSHDLALESLWARVRQVQPTVTVSASYVGSLDGLLALLHGEADLAGAHILDEATGDYNLPILRRIFLGQPMCIVHLAEREQGLIVPAGNPLELYSWEDLARPGLRLVNRQVGSGTRTLLDHHLRMAQIAPQRLAGYDFVVPTHVASAVAVADGRADVAVGLYAAARGYDLAFVPLVRERYDLVLPLALREGEAFRTLLDVLRSGEYRDVVTKLGGYDTLHTGEESCI